MSSIKFLEDFHASRRVLLPLCYHKATPYTQEFTLYLLHFLFHLQIRKEQY
ncbi:hypothetical protein COCHEDRAFT_1024689 [Bipolaris maydis C5]|uniref:Uncharacterized protein n=1 Tax=Cochliobolus heterostrophus (strain C5 / ATCC 48332 / race O) TaxID=701091 RepID=M2UAP7_COCH5|nr:hypothetical protein COCHEDRAFT_1024689 [Bipolaris maydis C5]